MKARVTLAGYIGIALLLTSAGRAEDLEAVEKKIAAAAAKVKSVSAKLRLSSQMQMGDTSATQSGEGTYEMQREGDKIKARQEIKITMVRKLGEEETKTEAASLVVSDGDFSWTLEDMMGQKTVLKRKPDPKSSLVPTALLDEVKKTHELTLMPDETIDGHASYVIDAKPKAAGTSPMGRTSLAFDQEHGIITRVVTYGRDDKPVTTMTFTDLKFDERIDPKRFEFVTPEGARVVDQTVTPPPQTLPAATAPAPDPAKE